MLYPPTRVCTHCLQSPRLLRPREEPVRITLFTMTEGVCDGREVHLYCDGMCPVCTRHNPFLYILGCQSTFYPNYYVHRDVRVYYDGVPCYIKVSGTRYVEHAVLEHFLQLSLLSWTSATNAAHIYHQSLSRLGLEQVSLPQYRLRTEHVWSGFVINALLKNAVQCSYILHVLHSSDQKDCFTQVMHDRNAHMVQYGQPEFSHWCTLCVRCYNNSNDTAGECSLHVA